MGYYIHPQRADYLGRNNNRYWVMLMAIGSLIREPFLITMMALSLLLVGGLLASNWVERRRDQRVFALVQRARNERRQSLPLKTSNIPPVASRSKFFRWQFLVPALLYVGASLALFQVHRARLVVQAQTPESPSAGSGASAPHKPAERPEIKLWFKDFSAPDTRVRSFDPTRVSLWIEPGREESTARIHISEPLGNVADARVYSSPGWDRVTDVRSPKTWMRNPSETLELPVSKQ